MSYIPKDKKFVTNEIDDTTTTDITYLGKEASDGEWWITVIDETGDTAEFQHATFSNNGTVSPNSYDQAWSLRVSLTYGNYTDVF